MYNVEQAKIKLTVIMDYTETIQELIDDGEITTKKEIEEYMRDCLYEDLTVFASYGKITYTIKKEK